MLRHLFLPTARPRLFSTLLFVAFAVATAKANVTPEEKEARLQVLKEYMEVDLAKFEKVLQAKNPEPVTRDISAAALASIMLSKDVPKAQALLQQLFSLQNMAPNSPDYGDIPWQQNHPEIKDPNAIKFTALTLAPIFIRYGAMFPQEFQVEARAHLKAALAAITRMKPRVSYTNIFFMKATTEILLGEYLGDTASVALGKAGLEEWIRFTQSSGITEYNSAVYAGVQLNVLHTLYSNVQNAEIKALAGVILDYLWADAAANYFPGAEAISGSSSRTYSFLFHDLNVNHLYYLYGIQPTAPGRIGELSAEVIGWANGIWGGYAPSPELIALSREPTRLIRQSIGANPGQDRYNYITPSFSLGSSSFFFEHQDRQIALYLNSPKKLPAVSVVLDPFNAPYGKVRVLETTGGHYKITHLRNTISAVQEKGAVLALMDLVFEATKKTGGSVATNIVFPLGTDGLYLNGKPVSWDKEAIPVSNRSVIGIREGKSAVAMRIFHADGMTEDCPVFYIRNDGKTYGAGRLVAYHARGKDGFRPVDTLRSGVLILATECQDDEAFAKFFTDAQSWKIEESREKDLWKATASGPSVNDPGTSTTLAATLNLPARIPENRLVNGQNYAPQVFSINGRDIATEIWNKLPAITPARESSASNP